MHLLTANLQATRLQSLSNFRLFLSERQAREVRETSNKAILFLIWGGGGGGEKKKFVFFFFLKKTPFFF